MTQKENDKRVVNNPVRTLKYRPRSNSFMLIIFSIRCLLKRNYNLYFLDFSNPNAEEDFVWF